MPGCGKSLAQRHHGRGCSRKRGPRQFRRHPGLPGTIAAPGNDPLAITVGAMNTEGTAQRGDDLMTTYSSKGPSLLDHIVKPDLVAPGNKIFSIRAPGSTLESLEPANIVPLAAYAESPAPGQMSKLLHSERHQYGCRRDQRRGCRTPFAAEPDSGSGEGAADENSG